MPCDQGTVVAVPPARKALRSVYLAPTPLPPPPISCRPRCRGSLLPQKSSAILWSWVAQLLLPRSPLHVLPTSPRGWEILCLVGLLNLPKLLPPKALVLKASVPKAHVSPPTCLRPPQAAQVASAPKALDPKSSHRSVLARKPSTSPSLARWPVPHAVFLVRRRPCLRCREASCPPKNSYIRILPRGWRVSRLRNSSCVCAARRQNKLACLLLRPT